MNFPSFINRHISANDFDTQNMLEELGYDSTESFINDCIDPDIQSNSFNDDPEISEFELLKELKDLSSLNKLYKTFIGQGYYNTHTPSVIQRNVLENPNWYTAYTPYQAEISQGRLESLFHFQTLIAKLAGLDFANASLLDEGTAAAEAMLLAKRVDKKNRSVFGILGPIFTQTRSILITRSSELNISLKFISSMDEIDQDMFGLFVQTPNSEGHVKCLSPTLEICKNYNIVSIVATDLLFLMLFKSPGEQGADIVVGSSQRFGVPLGYGGPHAAFFATKDIYKRQVPGRIVGKSIDIHKNIAYRLTLVTREQHIRREKATSNICTAQALLANIAVFYAIWHGKENLINIAKNIYYLTCYLKEQLSLIPEISIKHDSFFDTLHVICNSYSVFNKVKQKATKEKINLFYIQSELSIRISLDELTRLQDVYLLINLFLDSNTTFDSFKNSYPIKQSMKRDSLDLPTLFLNEKSEHWMTRWLKQLSSKDYNLTDGMIPLGSCTMKLNSSAYMQAISWPEFNQLHPFLPNGQVKGYKKIINYLESKLSEITGMDHVSLQPNSGASGEYAGLLAIKKYHRNNKNIILIPASAHGTNPASAHLAGFKTVNVKQKDNGYICIDNLKEQLNTHKDNIAGIMITYPSTFGIYEEKIKVVTDLVHQFGGVVYLDGANLNAQIGLVKAAELGFDVMHFNLHKTFAIPHGGGGPGVGPIAVKSFLKKFVPKVNISQQPLISAAPYGSALILLISYAYLRLMGSTGLKRCAFHALLNANYIAHKLKSLSYELPFLNKNRRSAHEVIIDFRKLKKETGVSEVDIAKRLMDYGFHAPTMSWPVVHTMMIEPTESESKQEIDRFINAMKNIKLEIDDYQKSNFPKYHVLKDAPFTLDEVINSDWPYPYSRKQALPNLRPFAFTKRINDSYGDINFCACS